MSRKNSIIAVITMGLALTLLVGCVGEDGVRLGVTTGISQALQALIAGPVEAWVDAAFP